jgi:DNA modification methylase
MAKFARVDGLTVKIESRKINNLTHDPRNARTHDDKNLKAIAASLDTFGQRKPIVVTVDGVILAGNGTVSAARTLGWETVDVVVAPADWDDATAKAFALADNRSAELAEWDTTVLASQLVELDSDGWDITALGFDVPNTVEGRDVVEDEAPVLDETPARAALGDVWRLGRHRLMCGDSTNPETVSKLMNGNTADMVFTDPPYGVEYQSNMRTKSQKFDVLANDDTLLNIAPSITQFSTGWVFIWTSWKVLPQWIEKMSPLGYPTNMIVWDKGGGYIGDLKKTFGDDYEIALVWHRQNELTGKRIGSVWSINKDNVNTYQHPTQKPVTLGAQAITHTTNLGDTILDLFGGSGSTLIACEQTNRTCYMMELDPKYVDVILTRWENLTGLKAELLT